MKIRSGTLKALLLYQFPLVLLTAHQFLTEAATLKQGQSILIHASASAVGNAAIQLAKHTGLHVMTTASIANTDFVKSLGADRVIDRRH